MPFSGIFFHRFGRGIEFQPHQQGVLLGVPIIAGASSVPGKAKALIESDSSRIADADLELEPLGASLATPCDDCLQKRSSDTLPAYVSVHDYGLQIADGLARGDGSHGGDGETGDRTRYRIEKRATGLSDQLYSRQVDEI